MVTSVVPHPNSSPLKRFQLSSFPEEVQKALKAFDNDNSGTIDLSELAAAALRYKGAFLSLRLNLVSCINY